MAGKTRISVEGVERVVESLRHHGRKHRNVKFVVGFQAFYALWVHEKLDVSHPTGQAKFLEEPARTQGNAIAAACRQAMKAGADLEVGLKASADKLLELAKARVPVDTGFLRDSGFVRKEAT